MALSITLSICQNRQIQMKQANISGECAFLFCFLKNEHIATEVISCLILFIAVHSRRSPICVKRDSVQTAWAEEPARHAVCSRVSHYAEKLEAGRPGEPVMQEPELQKDLSTAKHAGKWKAPMRSTRATVTCCCVQWGAVG